MSMASGRGHPVPPAGPLLPQMSQTVLHSGLIRAAIHGRFTSSDRAEVVLVRDGSLQLHTEELVPKGSAQPLLAGVEDIQLLRGKDHRWSASTCKVCKQSNMLLP